MFASSCKRGITEHLSYILHRSPLTIIRICITQVLILLAYRPIYTVVSRDRTTILCSFGCSS